MGFDLPGVEELPAVTRLRELAGGKAEAAEEAEVVELLPNATYRLRLANEDRVLAHAAGATKANFVRLRLGDRVKVERSPHDRTRGRITGLIPE